MQLASEKRCKNFQLPMIIDFYASLIKRGVHKSFIHDVYLIFMQSALEEGCKNFQFPIIIDFRKSA